MKKINVKQTIAGNLAVVFSYWAISHLNWMMFSRVGVLPMPIWPAAALALVVALYRGWHVAPGIALGTILSNHFSLGAPWDFSLCISIMNTAGPVWGAGIIRKRIAGGTRVKSLNDFIVVLLIGIGWVPLLTALGGVGSKCLLGLLPYEDFFTAFARWAMAHSLGTLLFALPYLIWIEGRKKE